MENVINENKSSNGCGRRKNSNNMIAGIILIAIGLLFLLEKFVGISFGDMWPIIIIVVGGCIVFKSIRSKNSNQ